MSVTSLMTMHQCSLTSAWKFRPVAHRQPQEPALEPLLQNRIPIMPDGAISERVLNCIFTANLQVTCLGRVVVVCTPRVCSPRLSFNVLLSTARSNPSRGRWP